MIELNLLPVELRKKKKSIELPEIPLVPIAIVFVGALLVIQLILGGLIFLSKKQLVTLDKKFEDLLPKKAAFESTRDDLTLTKKKVEAVEGLMEKQLKWSRLLNELSNSITANIWLTELSYEEGMALKNKIRTLTLSGSAAGKSEETTAHIARFIQALKDNEKFFSEFDNIELVSIRKGRVIEQDVMNFTLACSFKLERPQEEEPKEAKGK